MFHVCSQADSMNSLKGEWYQEWQTAEPVASGGWSRRGTSGQRGTPRWMG